MRRLVRLLIPAPVVVGIVVTSASTASAVDALPEQSTVAASATPSAISVSVAGHEQPGKVTDAHLSASPPSSVPICSLAPASGSVQSLLGQPPGEPPGQWYWVTCNRPGYSNPEPPTFIPNGRGAAPPPSPAAVAQQALATAPLPSPGIGTDPDSNHLLTNYPTRLYLTSSWAPITASASVGGVSAAVTATPTRVTWSMGDGSTVVCNGPGSPYNRNESWASQNPPPCGYTYRHSSADQPDESYQLTATVTYQASWTAQGAAGGGSLGTVNRSSTIPVIVGEVQALEG